MIPQGVAFAVLAGMPTEYGLYAGMVPTVVAALFGSSWHLVSGPTTAASIIVLSAIGGFAEPGSPAFVQLVLTLTLMVGVIELGMGLLRMGALINFISHSVAIGFTAGAAILIAAHQVENFFGIPVPGSAKFYEVAFLLWKNATDISLVTVAIGTLTILSGILTKRLYPKFPHMLSAMFVGCTAAAVLALGFDIRMPSVQAIVSGIPPLSQPTFSLEVFRDLAPTAIAVAIFALTEALSISRALAAKSGQQIDGNQEFIGQGLSNLAGCFFSGYVATGSFNRSALNHNAGARTPFAAISAGIMLIIFAPLVAPYAMFLPKAVIAGILFLVVATLIDIPHIKHIIVSSNSDTTVMVATFLSVLFLNLEIAIFAGVALSLVFYLNRTSHPKITNLAPDSKAERRKLTTDPSQPECPQIRIIRIDGSLFYGAVSNVTGQLRRIERHNPGQKHLLVVGSGINFIDMEGAEVLADEARRRRAAGGNVYLVGIKEQVFYQIRRAGYMKTIGHKNIFDSKTIAIGAACEALDKEICQTCTARIFRECDAFENTAPAIEPPMETVVAPEPSVAEPVAASIEAPSLKPKKNTKPVRILALINFDKGTKATAEKARDMAAEQDGELALGQIIDWKQGSGSLLQSGLIAAGAEAALCVSARMRLSELADETSIDHPTLLASAVADPSHAVLELIEDFAPDIILVHRRADYGLARRAFMDFDTPHGRVRCQVRTVG